MSTSDMKQAREWARDNIEGGYFHGGDRALAAARVIQSLPDQWIDAEKLREVLAEQYMKIEGNDRKWINAATIESLLAPSLPTLADMTPEEREWCQWMQAISGPDSGYTDGPVVIVQVDDNLATLMWVDGSFDTRYHQHITPLPDLPRLEWPAQEPRNPETPPTETLNNPSSDTPRSPRPEDVPAGEPWLVKCDGHEWVGTRESRVETVCSWTLARLDGADYTVARDDEITLVSRLVPEDKP